MWDFRVLFYNRLCQVSNATVIRCKTDEEAIERLSGVRHPHSIELWQGLRRIHAFPLWGQDQAGARWSEGAVGRVRGPFNRVEVKYRSLNGPTILKTRHALAA